MRLWFSIWFFISLVVLPGLAASQEDDELDEISLEVEGPSGYDQSIFWSPSAVSVITWDDILLSGATSVADLLRRVPGMDVYYMKTYFPLIGARGRTDLSNSRVLMLVDGREELIDLSGYPLWGALTFDVEDIRRIEVIRGPSSTLYGTNAISAVVKITTVSREPSSDAEIMVSGGELGRLRMYFEVSDSWSLGGGDLAYGVHAGLEGKRSFSDTRDKDAAPQLHGYLRYRLSDLMDLSLLAGTSIGSGGEGLISIDMGDIGMVSPYTYWAMAKGRFVLGEGLALLTQFYYNHAFSNLRYRTGVYAYNSWVGDMAMVAWTADALDLKAHLDWSLSDSLRLLAGIHSRVNLMEGRHAVMSDEDEFRGGVFAQAQWRVLPEVELTAGLRLDYNLEVDPALCPRLAAVYRPRAAHAFRLSYSAAFRKPSDFESRLHLEAGDTNPAMPEAIELMAESIGNSGLQNETAHGFEAGWRGRFPGLNLEAAANLFFNMHRDTIVLFIDVPELLGGVPDLRRSTVRYQNSGTEVDVLGSEVELHWYPLDDLVFWGNLTVKGSFDHQSGDRLVAEPVLRINLGGGYRPASGLFMDTAVHYVSSYDSTLIVPDDPLLGRARQRLGNQCLFIGNLGYRLELAGTRFLDAGLALRQPLGLDAREVAGVIRPRTIEAIDVADFGGEILTRLVWAYLRWSY